MAARLIGRLLIAVIIYLTVGTAVFFASFVLYRSDIAVNVPWLISIERKLYFSGGWHVWQAQADCVDFDPRLIYKPKLGTCRFANIEYDTTPTFTRYGRKMAAVAPGGSGIAVIGDSFAMGWGVEDAETYSAELQRRTGRKVYNLAVSSYGTVRELMRLESSGLLDAVDTVIIDYCDNDLDENLNFTVPTPAEARNKFREITAPRLGDRRAYLRYLLEAYKFAIKLPFSEAKRLILGRGEREDFVPHYEPLMKAIRGMPALSDKRVFVIYTNSYGAKFKNFPTGRDKTMKNVVFVDLNLVRQDFYLLDSHLNRLGHERIGRELAEVVKMK